MVWLYVICISCLFIYTIFRKIDFLSFAAFSFIIYTMPCLAGKVWIRGYNQYYYYSAISNQLYSIICMQLVLTLLYLMFYDFRKRYLLAKKKLVNESNDSQEINNKYNNDKKEKWICTCFKILLIIVYASTIKNIYTIGISNLSLHKSKIIAEMSSFYTTSVIAAIVIFIYAYKNKKKYLKLFSLPIVLLNLFIGSRALITTLFVSLFVINSNRLQEKSKGKIKYLIIGIVALFFILLYKQIYILVKLGDWHAVFDTLINYDTYIKAVTPVDSTINISIYNYIIDYKYFLEGNDVLGRLVSFIPFVNNYIDVSHSLRFSQILKNEIFHSSYGLASCIWAEVYAMFGIIGIFIFQLLWLRLLEWGNKHIYSLKTSVYFILPTIAYLSFYIHRLDYLQVFGIMKSMLMIYLIWLSIYKMGVIKK
ncbi:O-antigen polymerase [Clostridium sp.]|uniref:O-antigen polymerase n=1 Tax=Clostridium sp. TaxID=1506 RepID=UPI0032179181